MEESIERGYLSGAHGSSISGGMQYTKAAKLPVRPAFCLLQGLRISGSVTEASAKAQLLLPRSQA